MSRVVKPLNNSSTQEFRIIKNNGKLDEDIPLLFTFSDFKLKSISLDGFNNFYRDEAEYLRKLTIFLGKALPLLSNERMSIFTDRSKMNSLHLHLVKGKDDLLRAVFEQYNFSSTSIDNILEGQNIYQFEVPFENGATRIVFQRIDNLISFLFMDPNHHVYINRNLVNGNGSLFYEICPINEIGECDRMNYLQTCFMFDYLDKELYEQTYSYSSPAEEINN